MTLRGVFAGALALIALEALITAQPGRVTGLFGSVAAGVQRILDPSVPAIPDLSGGGDPGTTDPGTDPGTGGGGGGRKRKPKPDPAPAPGPFIPNDNPTKAPRPNPVPVWT